MAPSSDKSVPEVIAELWQLLKDYAAQETLGPLKDLGKYFKYGLTGALLVTAGVLFLAMGVLRGLQRFEFTDYGIGTSVPYLAAVAFLVLVAVLSGVSISRTKKQQLPHGGKLQTPDLGHAPKEIR